MTKKLLLIVRSLFSNSSNNNRNVVVKERFFSLKSHRINLLLALLFVCFSFNFAGAQTTLFEFNFSNNNKVANTNNTIATPTFTESGVTGTITNATTLGCSGLSRMYSANNWASGDYYRFEANTTGYGNMTFSFCNRTTNTDIGTFMVRVSTDSGTNWTQTGINFIPSNGATGATTSFTIPALANNSAVVWIDILKVNTGNNSRTLFIDDVILAGYPIPNITSFTPTSTCAGTSTSVVITGTNFTGATAVSFNGVAAASYVVNSSTKITAMSPTTATTGTISVSNSNGSGTSGSSFIVNPLPTITAAASPTSVASGGTSVLTATPTPASTVDVTVLQEDFNAATNNWTTTNTSTGGTPANANWTLRPNGYTYNYPGYPINTFNSNDNSQFYLTNSAEQGSAGTTRTTLQSPSINTVGLTTLSLEFYQYFLNFDTDDDCYVDVSTNGTTWTNVATYSVTQGSQNNFKQTTVNLDSYINNAALYVRFRYAGKFDWYWAIDNVTISGTRTNSYTYSWTANPAGVTAGLPAGAGTANLANKIINVTPTQNTNYTVTVTNTATGCAATAIPVLVTIAAPTITSFAPTSACTGAGGSVVITGNNFNAATAVSFNGVASSFTVNSNTQITATVPITATTGTISITTIGGTVSSSSSFTVNAVLSAVAVTGTTPQTICVGAAGTVLTAAETGGGTITGRQWGKRSASGGTITAISGATSSTYIPDGTALGAGTWYLVCTSTPTCGSAVTSNERTVTVNAALSTVVITGTTPQSICLGATGTVLTAAETGGGTITGRQWGKRSASGGTITAISGATGSTYTPDGTALGAGTWYLVCTSTPTCGSAVTSNEMTVTVNPSLSAVAVTGTTPQTICVGAAGTVLTAAETGGATITSRQWGKRSVSGGTITAISGATGSTYTPDGTALGAGTWYLVCTSTPTCGSAVTSNERTVTVNAALSAVAVTGTTPQTICVGAAGTVLTAAETGGGTITSRQWGKRSVSGGTITAISGATGSTYIPDGTALGTGTWYLVCTSTPTCGSAVTSNEMTVTVNAALSAVAVTGTTPQTICVGAAGTVLTAAETGGGTITGHQWGKRSVSGGTITAISGATGATYTPDGTALGAGTWYLVCTSTPTCGSAVTSNEMTVTVNAALSAVAVTGTTPQAICVGAAGTVLTAAETGGGTITGRQWGKRSVSGGTITAISGATGSTYTPDGTALGAGTWYLVCTSTPTCGSAVTSNERTVTVNAALSAVAVTGTTPQSICLGAAGTVLTAAETGGGTITSRQWGKRSVSGGTITAISGATGSTYTPDGTVLGAGTWYLVCTSTPTCGSAITSNERTVTVNAALSAVAVTGTTPQTICIGAAGTVLTASETGGGTITGRQWGKRSVSGGTVTAISGATGSTYTPDGTALGAGTWYLVCTSTPTCGSASTSNEMTVTVNAALSAVAVTGTTSQTICVGAAGTVLTASETGGGTITSRQWGKRSVSGGTITAISGATGSTYTPDGTALGAGTWYLVCTSTPTCGSAVTSNERTVTVNAYPTITTPPQALNLCVGQNGSFKLVPGVTAQSYQWEYSSDGVSGWQITDTAADVTGHTTTELSLTNVQLGYSGYYVRCVLTNGTCAVYTTPVQLTVNPLPTAPTASVTTQPTCALNTATITVSSPAAGSGFEYSLDGTAYVISAVFTGVSVGPHNITVKRTSTGCESAQTPITVAPSAAKKWNGSTSTDWNTAANWTPNGVPTLADCVEIPNISVKPVIEPANGHYNAYTLTVDANGSLTVGSTNTLTVENAVTVLGSGATAGALIFENNSSLLQTSTASNINTGNITYKRTTSLVRRYDLTFWSSPVTLASGFKLYDLSPQTLGDKFYIYNSLTESWITDYNGGTVMVPGKGYTVRAPQTYDIISTAYFTASFVGVPNNGDILLGTLGSKWNFGGNPYPSALNAKKLITDNGNVGSLYLWTHSTAPSNVYLGDGIYNYNTADYAVFNLTGTAATTSPSNIPTGYIAAGQGFFFTPSDSNGIKFTNDMRVVGSNEQFFKNEKADDVDKSRVWLNLTNKDGAFKQALIGYVDGATNNWDMNYDAPTISGNSYIDFYSINDSRKLTVQGRALPFDNSEVVPLGYKSTIAGDFTIAIDHADGLFSEQAVYLEDKTTGKIQNLTTGNYNFTTAIGTFTDRFVLRYTNKTLGTDDFENLENTVLVSVKDKVIKINASKESIKEVTIYDVSGKLLYNKNKVEATELQISNLQSSNQVLLVKVTLENDFTTTKKAIFK